MAMPYTSNTDTLWWELLHSLNRSGAAKTHLVTYHIVLGPPLKYSDPCMCILNLRPFGFCAIILVSVR